MAAIASKGLPEPPLTGSGSRDPQDLLPDAVNSLRRQFARAMAAGLLNPFWPAGTGAGERKTHLPITTSLRDQRSGR